MGVGYDILTYLMAALAGLSIVLSFLLGYLEPGLQKAGVCPRHRVRVY